MRLLRALRRIWSLPRDDRFLLLKTFVLVACVRLSLTLFSYRAIRDKMPRLIERLKTRGHIDARTQSRIVWAVTQAGHRIPEASCLTQAIATQILLARKGESSLLHIGVAKGESGKFEAHAWVERAGEVVIGGTPEHLARYTPLTAFER